MTNYFKRIKFNLQAQTAHGLHSPFVYKLYSEVLNPQLQKGYNKEQITHSLQAYFQLSDIYFSKNNHDYENKLILVDQNNLELFSIALKENLIPFSGSIILINNPHAYGEKIWEVIIEHPIINFSIDIFDLGILTIDKIAPKQNFKLKKLS